MERTEQGAGQAAGPFELDHWTVKDRKSVDLIRLKLEAFI
jgi:hypothetical protein